MDPALIDRTTTPILGIDVETQSVRPMTIAGIEGRLPAKILSTNLRGAGTRIVSLQPRWGTRLAGSFTADVSVFVLRGDVQIGSLQLRDYEFSAIPKGRVVGSFRTEGGAVALLMTSGPVRYDTSTGGATAQLISGRPSESSWQNATDGTRLYRLPLVLAGEQEIWLGSTQQDHEDPIWQQYGSDQETLVLDGDLWFLDLVDGKPKRTNGSSGHYFFRPAGTSHAGPIPAGEATTLTFNRSFGPSGAHIVEAPTAAQST